MDDVYAGFPTIFELQIRELGWIHDVYAVMNGCDYVPFEWVGYVQYKNGCRYSIFRLEYTFENTMRNAEAIFHYFIEGKERICKPMTFDVT